MTSKKTLIRQTVLQDQIIRSMELEVRRLKNEIQYWESRDELLTHPPHTVDGKDIGYDSSGAMVLTSCSLDRRKG